jgi:crotonobetainyl-CoA:carnitine CoA-transferase CaiB-like acyl-CoA transferase
MSVDVPGIGPVVVPAALPRLSETPGEVKTLGPTLGEANHMIYGERLGLSDVEIEQLIKDGVI